MGDYGLAQGFAEASRGYREAEKEEAAAAEGTRVAGLEERKMGMLEEQTAGAGEERQAKLQQMRSGLAKEGFAESVKRALAGDLRGAETEYNRAGEDRMEVGSLKKHTDKESGMKYYTFKDGKTGEQHTMLEKQLLVLAGIKPGSISGKSKKTAYIQNLEYTMKKLTGGDARKAFELMQISKSDPQAAYSRILIGLQKQNKDAFDEEKMTDDEMRQAAKDSVTGFRKEMFDELLGEQESPAPAQGDNDPMRLF